VSAPTRIGRYEIAAPLTAGGMAEILLGRLIGPRGFERPVVIKRILPHLARSSAFVAMFLDEARIVARIQHPNVVSVLELGQSGGELFLVLEYLDGESVGSLARRLALDGASLPPLLAAYIVAEACAGLHAAHEFVAEDGAPQEIVHRDVSPQNLFVTYQGRVVVLDFGIAKAKDRLARTETGALKGKLEYMSPEQCLGDPLDRRTDVFALGAVLYELTTGTRLFRRKGQLATMDAITREPVLSPSRLVESYPPSLERICMRALERQREDRYGTAGEMRRDLLAAIRELETPLDPEPGEALGRLMREVFATRAAEKRALLQRLREGKQVANVPANEFDDALESTETRAAATLGGSAKPRAVGEPGQARRRRRAFTAIVLGAMAFLLALGVALSIRLRRAPSKEVTDLALSTTAPAADVPQAELRIASQPPGAKVSVDGAEKGTTPFDLRVQRTTEPLQLELRHAGFRPLSQRIVPDRDREVLFTLEPERRTTETRKTRPPSPPSPPASGTTSPFRRFE
jgi:eukaryotic-like serine/threonine-protein kinase